MDAGSGNKVSAKSFKAFWRSRCRQALLYYGCRRSFFNSSFEDKNKIKIDIIADNSLIIPEYIIDLQNKSKKTIETVQHIERLKNLEEQEIKPSESSYKKKPYKKKPFFKKKFYKKAV